MGQSDDLAVTEVEARRMAVTLREAGINWNLAPVVDVGVNPLNPAVVALGRTFSSDPDQVVAHARAFIKGMHAEGILTALKHFPGHGSSQRDSHAGFVDVTDTADLDAELLPYRVLIEEGLADSVMTAHVFNRGLDPWDPATLSRYTINGILRSRFGYKGVVVSDDLLMGAIDKHYGLEEAAALALDAGVDVLLIADDMPKAEVYGAERVVLAINRAIRRACSRASESSTPSPASTRSAPVSRANLDHPGTLPTAVATGAQERRSDCRYALHVGAIRQRVLRAAPRAGERRGGAGERDGLLEIAARGEADRERAVERVARGGRVDGRHGEGGEMERACRRRGRARPLAERDEHAPGAPRGQALGRLARRVEILDGSAGQRRSPRPRSA